MFFSYVFIYCIFFSHLTDFHFLDVIGFVADVKDLKKFKTARGKDTKKLNVIIQDLEMESIYLSLWDSYADRILEQWENREQHGVIVVILQFGTLKYFGRFGYVNSCFNVSKLFINSDVDEMTAFRNSLIANSAASSCSSQSSRLSGIFLSLYDEYVVRSEFNNIAEVNLNQAKSVVVVGTVQMISEDLPWYYFACKTCNKKVFPKVTNDTPTVGVLVDEEEVYECKTKTCKDTVIQYTKRLKIPLTVQDSSGTVSLTLFDRDACRILNTTAANLIEKHVAGGDKGLYPDEFEALLGKKFAFKIDISEFNIEHNFWFFGVSKLTDDEDIIFELEKKANNIEVETTASLNNRFTDMESEDTVNLNVCIVMITALMLLWESLLVPNQMKTSNRRFLLSPWMIMSSPLCPKIWRTLPWQVSLLVSLRFLRGKPKNLLSRKTWLRVMMLMKMEKCQPPNQLNLENQLS
ncbi:putative nucleic acid-binding, replication factor A [Helianthus annuus]|uniref:Nucleic acid-binding, replication factor A n=1 Tax=Helianthus annuus TaxID=4232 RepID=A0A9K3DG65_HELAN|nr:putative nucleic acid-binding, replication factor A [Helianthus annuus]